MDIHYKTVVGDNQQRITDILNIALDRVDFVLMSGGLGPTVDDVTRQAVAAATNRELVYSEELEAQIMARFRSFDRAMPENNKRQAWIPEATLTLGYKDQRDGFSGPIFGVALPLPIFDQKGGLADAALPSSRQNGALESSLQRFPHGHARTSNRCRVRSAVRPR